MFEYRVGDNVRIKNKKWYNILKDSHGDIPGKIVAFGFNQEMSKYCGKIGIITDVFDTYYYRGNEVKQYKLDIDDGYWSWSEDMFDLNKNILEIE